MATYTYDQFEQAAKASGLYNQFSSADLSLAAQNPDAGMSILKYKQDFANATTDEARALANLGAEGIRSSYGNYTGGNDGGSFALDPLSPSSFNVGAAPAYTNNYADDIANLWAQQQNYGSYNYGIAAPTYNNRYDDQIQQLLGEVINREEFSYDPATDPLYSQYRKQYAREGQRATQDALGAAAAASGGIPSSYASTAAGQAANYYAAQMTDKIPELYELAYNKYLNDYNMKLSDLDAVQGAEQSDYAKYLSDLQQYNTDRSFDYNAWLDRYNMIANNLQSAQGLEQSDYNKYLNELNQYNTDRSFNYGVLLDEINSQTQERQETMNKALTAAEYGDYSFLQDMGIDTSNNPTDWERQYNLALLAAQYGDYSGLKSLGVDTSGYEALQAAKNSDGDEQDDANGKWDNVETWVSLYGEDAAENYIREHYKDLGYSSVSAALAGWQNHLTESGDEEEAEAFDDGAGDISTVKDYDGAIAYMKSAGVDSSVRAGMMTRDEWTRRKASLQQYGTGSAEVKNYGSYADYVRDYVQYAVSK